MTKMKIAVMQAGSQKSKNKLLYECVRKAAGKQEHEVINFGIFREEEVCYSYVQTALCISILLESQAVDFVVTGCSSGQGTPALYYMVSRIIIQESVFRHAIISESRPRMERILMRLWQLSLRKGL